VSVQRHRREKPTPTHSVSTVVGSVRLLSTVDMSQFVSVLSIVVPQRQPFAHSLFFHVSPTHMELNLSPAEKASLGTNGLPLPSYLYASPSMDGPPKKPPRAAGSSSSSAASNRMLEKVR
jgi:hypothetical protein